MKKLFAVIITVLICAFVYVGVSYFQNTQNSYVETAQKQNDKIKNLYNEKQSILNKIEEKLNDIERAQLSIMPLFHIEKEEFVDLMVKAVDITTELKNPEKEIEEIKSVVFKLLNRIKIEKEAQEIFKMTKLEWANPKIIDMFTKEKVEETERRVTAEVTESVTAEVTESVTTEVTESVTERIAKEMLNNNLSIDKIAKITGLSVNRIKSL